MTKADCSVDSYVSLPCDSYTLIPFIHSVIHCSLILLRLSEADWSGSADVPATAGLLQRGYHGEYRWKLKPREVSLLADRNITELSWYIFMPWGNLAVRAGNTHPSAVVNWHYYGRPERNKTVKNELTSRGKEKKNIVMMQNGMSWWSQGVIRGQ